VIQAFFEGAGPGTIRAIPGCMNISRHRDLDAWTLADAVRRAFIPVLDRDELKYDLDFRTQTRKAMRSACRNIAEGSYRYRHPEFANLVNIAIGSLGELLDGTDDALEHRYIDDVMHRQLNAVIEQAIACAVGLEQHLLSTPTPSRRPGHAS